MALTFFSANYGQGAELELAGKCHVLNIGDSQSTAVLDYLWYDAWPRACPVRYHYLVGDGANAGQTISNNFGFLVGNGQNVDAGVPRADVGYVYNGAITSNSAANPTVVTTTSNHGLVSGDVVTIASQTGTVSINGTHTVTVTAANTFTIPVDCTAGGGTGGTFSFNVSSYSIGPVRITRFVSDIAADTVNSANGLILPRQNSPASHTNGSRQAAWPTFTSNSSQPWFHGSHVKAKIVVWKDAATLDRFAIYVLRQGTSSNNNNEGTRVQVDVSAAATGPVASDWTDVLADAGNYDVSVNGINNDHECALRLYSSSAVYDETGKTLIPLGAIFARCNASGVIPWNADNSGAGFDAIGRSGAYVSDWLNYCTQAHWQAYFTATVLVPNQVTKIRIMLGHNCNPGTIDVGDGDGAQAEQAAGLTTVYWKKRYKAFIDRLKAAYAAAFPSGKLHLELIVPWVSRQSSATSTPTTAADINRVVKEVAAETGASWFSFYDYWNGVAPFYNLHAWTPANGQMLATALRDAMDRATNYKYSDQGPLPASRQFRDARV